MILKYAYNYSTTDEQSSTYDGFARFDFSKDAAPYHLYACKAHKITIKDGNQSQGMLSVFKRNNL
jgi:hypothetical protein